MIFPRMPSVQLGLSGGAFRRANCHLAIVNFGICQRIGHGGASALAPANTLASFDAAVAIGVDVVEFDVRAGRDGLVLAHTILDARRADQVRLSDALAYLSRPRF